MLHFLLPVVWLLIGVAVARNDWIQMTCSLGEWR